MTRSCTHSLCSGGPLERAASYSYSLGEGFILLAQATHVGEAFALYVNDGHKAARLADRSGPMMDD